MTEQKIDKESASSAKARLIAVYMILLFVSLLSFVGINIYMVSSAVDDRRDTFFRQANESYQHLLQVTQSTNYLLDGFSALVSGMGLTNYGAIVQYTDQVLARVPHVYQIQMAQRVESDELEKFSEDQRVFLDFSVKVFDGVEIIDANESDGSVFYPISFVADREAGSYSNLGIDVMSFPFLSPSVKLSSIKRMTVISEPFETLDEELVFVMVQPAFFEGQEEPDFYTFLLIKSNILLFPGHQEGNYDISVKVKEHEDYLLSRESRVFESAIWLPYFQYEQEFKIGAQTLNLKVSHQMEWSEINLTLLGVLWGGASLVMLSFFFMFRLHFNSELTKLKQSELLYEMANFDALTHLANRRHFHEALNYSVSQAVRRNSRLALMYLDLDGFKQINDTFGHDAGDEVLKLAADKISSSVRSVDVVGRLGGDEFAVILNDLSDDQGCEQMRKRIQSEIESIDSVGDYTVKLGTSIGVAFYPYDAKSAEELLSLADERMYQDKRKRKDGAPSGAGNVTNLKPRVRH